VIEASVLEKSTGGVNEMMGFLFDSENVRIEGPLDDTYVLRVVSGAHLRLKSFFDYQ
jgi:hypothetical protein